MSLIMWLWAGCRQTLAQSYTNLAHAAVFHFLFVGLCRLPLLGPWAHEMSVAKFENVPKTEVA